ncbi:ATP-binding protein [Paenibacillus sp. MBLB4367]|uniref:HAMP domain-containing sensor histidine kinase n=1 Tax=Paenibacillus sp. MBLB4367 TaxID=3384767 RepID=UPI0039080265
MKKRQRIARGLMAVLSVLAYNLLCFTAAYYLTDYLYEMTGKHPHDLFKQLITALLSFLLLAATAFSFALFNRKRHIEFFHSMLDALRRISKGDFNVNLAVRDNPNEGFGKLAEGINHMAEQLNQMEQMRQEFISNVSHEIQSPLTSMSGFARILRTDRLNEEDRHHYLTIIEAESRRLSKLSDNLLRLTSLESKHHPFEPKRYRLDKQLRHIVLACEPQWLEKKIDMDVSLGEAWIVADEEMLSQVWVNLIHNSIKFTPEGGSIGIELLQNQTGDGLESTVRISDSGIGIAEDDLPHVFERFYKADKARTRAGGGSGLGLSIAHKIVGMHNGDIRVRSKPLEGATFIVTLPSAKAQI